MPIADGLREVDRALKDSSGEAILVAALDRARARAAATNGLLFGVAACETTYGAFDHAYNLEIATWFQALLLAEYTAGILAQKSEEGHCNAHRLQPELKPCPVMAREHLRMLVAFREDLTGLVAEIHARIAALASGPAAS